MTDEDRNRLKKMTEIAADQAAALRGNTWTGLEMVMADHAELLSIIAKILLESPKTDAKRHLPR
jgi:hypothetical protein